MAVTTQTSDRDGAASAAGSRTDHELSTADLAPCSLAARPDLWSRRCRRPGDDAVRRPAGESRATTWTRWA